MNRLIFSVLCGIALFAGVCAVSDTVERENIPDMESLIESREKRSFHHLKHWLHKLNPHRLFDKIFHRHQEDEETKPDHWDKKPPHWFRDVKPVPTEKPTHSIPKFDYFNIYPGTKWCGAGNIARTVKDLGWKWGLDTCCRRHDLCSHSISAKEQKYGLDNRGLFTWSHCDCDREFYECLKRDQSLDADVIGVSYFNGLNNFCIYLDYQQHCSKRVFLKAKCQKLTTKPKVWKKRRISLSYT